jgi:hypothetical protein
MFQFPHEMSAVESISDLLRRNDILLYGLQLETKRLSKKHLAVQCESIWLDHVISYLDAPVLRRFCVLCGSLWVLAAVAWKARLDVLIQSERRLIEDFYVAEAAFMEAQSEVAEKSILKDNCKRVIQGWTEAFAANHEDGRGPVRYMHIYLQLFIYSVIDIVNFDACRVWRKLCRLKTNSFCSKS